MPEHEPDLDELASAYLDGETTGDEAARVEDDPSALARVDRLAAVADAIAQPVDLPAVDQREDQIAAALTAALPETTTVASLAAQRERRAARQTRLVAIASVAVVAVLALVALPLMLRGGDDTSELATEPETPAEPEEVIEQDALEDEGDATLGEQPTTESAEQAPLSTVTPGVGASPDLAYTGDLGDFATVEDLVEEVQASAGSHEGTGTTDSGAATGSAQTDPLAGCTGEDLAALGTAGVAPTAVWAASVDGEPFTVVYLSGTEMPAYLVDLTTCEVVEVTTAG
ncbi:MAG: hypothetical protein DCC48_12370 [Acidobacteria bacterium]|nr:MAG: hypothetical protein DCC48_12370 [Acidobacteriota bacterium]